MIVRLLAGNAKAVIGALVALLGALQVGLAGGLSGQEAIGALIAGLVAFGGVYAIPNLGQADPQKVVDAVKDVVPTEVADVIDIAVDTTKRGVLRNVVGAVTPEV